jgi:hypothetical protein
MKYGKRIKVLTKCGYITHKVAGTAMDEMPVVKLPAMGSADEESIRDISHMRGNT